MLSWLYIPTRLESFIVHTEVRPNYILVSYPHCAMVESPTLSISPCMNALLITQVYQKIYKKDLPLSSPQLIYRSVNLSLIPAVQGTYRVRRPQRTCSCRPNTAPMGSRLPGKPWVDSWQDPRLCKNDKKHKIGWITWIMFKVKPMESLKFKPVWAKASKSDAFIYRGCVFLHFLMELCAVGFAWKWAAPRINKEFKSWISPGIGLSACAITISKHAQI